MKKTSGILIVTLTLIIVSSIANSEPEKPVYRGILPSGERYYSACIAAGNLNITPGEEIVITDDYGAYQILAWDKKNNTFTERWFSDPIFESARVKEIYLPSKTDKTKSYMIFRDSNDSIHVFEYLDYLVEESDVDTSGLVVSDSIYSDFTFGEFNTANSGCEFLTLRCGGVSFSGNVVKYGIINVGSVKNGTRNLSANAIIGLEAGSHFMISHTHSGNPQGVFIVSPNTGKKGQFTIYEAYPPFSSYRKFTVEVDNIQRFGWCGYLDGSDESYITWLKRLPTGESQIVCLPTSDKRSMFSINVPSDISKWVFADLDGDSLRELVILDFKGHLSVYNLSGYLK